LAGLILSDFFIIAGPKLRQIETTFKFSENKKLGLNLSGYTHPIFMG